MSTTAYISIDMERNLIIQGVFLEAPAQRAASQRRGAVEYAQTLRHGFMRGLQNRAELGFQVEKGAAYTAGSLVSGRLVWLIRRRLTQ